MDFSKKITFFFIFFQILSFGNVFADEKPAQKVKSSGKDVVVIDEVIVSGSRLQKPPSAMPNTVTIIESEQLKKSTVVNYSLSAVLEKNVPGFGPSLNRLTGRAESLRGRNPLYLIDGVPQFNALRDGSRDGHTIDMDMVERIEVIHGSNAIQGVGATGGVINIVTKRANKDGKFHSDVRLGFTTHDSFNSDSFSYKGTYNGSIDLGKLDIAAGITEYKRGLFFDGDGDEVGLYLTQGDIVDSLSQDLFFKAGFEPVDGHRIQFTANDFNLERDGDFKAVVGSRAAGIVTSATKGDPSADVGDPAENDVTTLSLDYTAENVFDWRLVSQLYYQDFAALFEGGTFGNFYRLTTDGGPFLDQSQIVSRKVGVKITAANKDLFIQNLDLTLGFDVQIDRSKQILARTGREWVPETEQLGLAPFFQVDYELFNNFKLTSGLRVENVTLTVDDYTTIPAANSTPVGGGDPSFTELLPNVGAVYDVTSDISLYSSFSKGFTLPDVGRVLRAVNTPGQSVNSLVNLDPVVTDNLEFGIKYNDTRLNAEIAFYTSTSSLGSRLDLNSQGIFDVARERTEIMGLDFSAGYRINDHYKIGGSYAYIEAEFDANGDNEVDTDLDGLNVAPNRLNLYVEGDPMNDLNFRLSGYHLFTRDFEGPGSNGNANFEDSITLFDLAASYRRDFGTFSLGIENLLDNQYVTYFSQVETAQRDDAFFAGNGRTITLSFNKSF